MADDTLRPPLPPHAAPAARRREPWLAPAALVVLAVALGTVQFYAKPRPDPTQIAQFADSFTRTGQWVGRVAPDVEATRLDGQPFHLADDIGQRVVILNFFATWCVPCKTEMPELERYQRAAGDRVRLVGIDAQENRALVERFVRDLGITFPMAIDDTGEILKRFAVDVFPTTIVIGADGRVKLYETGAISNADVTLGAAVQAELEALTAGRGISRDAYLAAVAALPPTPDASDDDDTPVLNERARRIAAAMPCPCGCSDLVMACSCKTAKDIKGRLAAGAFGDQTDAQIMEALNKEFCMKGM